MLAALIVGALTAWYLGLRAGVIAAIATAAALIASAFVPGLTVAVYALVIAWSAALYFLGAKISAKKPGAAFGVTGAVTGVASQVSAWAKKLMGGRSKT
jgi:hypothetical protein